MRIKKAEQSGGAGASRRWAALAPACLALAMLAGCGSSGSPSSSGCAIGTYCPAPEPPERQLIRLASLGDRGRYFYNGYGIEAKGDHILAADADSSKVYRFDLDGNVLGFFGRSGGGQGEVSGLFDLAEGGDGTIFIADTFNNRVGKFGPKGDFVYRWGGEGAGEGQFIYPGGIAVFGDEVFVGDWGNSRVQRFTTDGLFLGQWDGSGTKAGKFNGPMGVSTDADGWVYICDRENGRVLKFSPDGDYLTSYKGMIKCRDAAADADGFVYVTDDQADLVVKFSETGERLAEWAGTEEPFRPTGITVDERGRIAVFNNPTPGSCCSRIELYAADGELEGAWGARPLDPGQLRNPTAAAVLADGRRLVADSIKNVIYIYDEENAYVEEFKIGKGQALESLPSDIEAFGTGWAALDRTAGRIVLFDGDDNFAGEIKVEKNGANLLFGAQGMGRTPEGGWAVANPTLSPSRVVVTDAAGNLKMELTGQEENIGGLDLPYDVAVNAKGEFYATDKGKDRVVKFSAEGEGRLAWGEFGSDQGQFDEPAGVDVDDRGRIYVADSKNSRIQVFAANGSFLDSIGKRGDEAGNFKEPSAVLTGADNALYVTDTGNDRIQIFAYQLNPK